MNSTLTDGPADGKAHRLLPQHLDDLRKSGLRDEIIIASRIYSESDPARVRAFLGGYLSTKTARALGSDASPSRSSMRTGNWSPWLPRRRQLTRGTAAVRPLQAGTSRESGMASL